jgi:hypothetical protein
MALQIRSNGYPVVKLVRDGKQRTCLVHGLGAGRRGLNPTLASIAADYGVGKIAIHDIFAGKKWKHLTARALRSTLRSPERAGA